MLRNLTFRFYINRLSHLKTVLPRLINRILWKNLRYLSLGKILKTKTNNKNP